MDCRIVIAVAVAALATACGGTSESPDASTTTEAAGPDPTTTKCSEFATLDADTQRSVVEKALEAKGGQEPDTMLPMVVGLCDQLPDSTVSEVLAGPAVATTSQVSATPEAPAETPTP